VSPFAAPPPLCQLIDSEKIGQYQKDHDTSAAVSVYIQRHACHIHYSFSSVPGIWFRSNQNESQTKHYRDIIVVLKLTQKTPPGINIFINFWLLRLELLALQNNSQINPRAVGERVKLSICQLLPDRRGGRPEISLSLRSHGGGTPPPLLAPGRVASPRHTLGVELVLLGSRCCGDRVVFNRII
jgi:hypothetical protein